MYQYRRRNLSNYNHPILARWIQFKRFREAQVLRIHAQESCLGIPSTDPLCAAARALIYQFNAHLGPYWDKRKKESDQIKELDAFLAHIRPIWNPILNPAGSPQSSWLARLHSADLAILRDDWKINCGPGAPISGSKVLSQVYGKSGQDHAAGTDDAPEFAS